MKNKTKNKLIIISGVSLLLFAGSLTLINKPRSNEKSVLGTEVRKYKALQVPNDPRYSSQWNLPKVGASTAWDTTTGSNSVKIAVLDTGIVTNHQDLQSKIIPGYDFIGNDSDPNPDPGGGSAVYHGTLVAGVVSAGTNNGIGVAGGCWNCQIMPIRVLDNNGEGTSDVIANGIRYAADRVKIINMSFGYAHSYGEDPYLTDAINYAYSKGVIMIAAAGNDGLGVNYPAAYNKVIAVAATNSSDVRQSWSSYGPEVDVSAPGVSVPSSYTYWNGSSYITDGYANASGTSISAPVVSGLAGLIYSTSNPSISNAMDIIKRSVSKVSGMSGDSDQYYGTGRISYDKAFAGVYVSNFSVSNPKIGQNIYVSVELTNNSANSVTLDSVYINNWFRYPQVNDRSFGGGSVTIGAYGSGNNKVNLNYSRRLTEAGDYGLWPVYLKNGNWYQFQDQNGNYIFNSYNASEPNIRASWFYIPDNNAIGSIFTPELRVINYDSSPITLDGIGIASWYNWPEPNMNDFGFPQVTINPGEEKSITFAPQRYDKLGRYRIWSIYRIGDNWYQLWHTTGYEDVAWINTRLPEVKASWFLVPENMGRGEFTPELRLVNYETYPVRIDSAGIACWLNWPQSNMRDFGFQEVTLQPGEEKSIIYGPQSLNEAGRYRAWSPYRIGENWHQLYHTTGFADIAWINVY